MSEEILKALMKLFAIIAKQDDGVTDAKRNYVKVFLKQQLSEEQVEEYYDLFEKETIDKRKRKEGKTASLTSVGDSVKTLGLCKKINKTLEQKQKIIVLVRLFELINSDRIFSEQRIAIIDTVSKVFKVTNEEFKSIEGFVISDQITEINDPNLLVIGDKQEEIGELCKFIRSESLHKHLLVLKIPSVNLYFLRYTGKAEIIISGLTLKTDTIYLFANGSSIKTPLGKPIYHSDVVSKFLSDTTATELSFEGKNIAYKFPNGNIGLRNISLSEGAGKLVGIMGASGAGKTTLLNVLSGIESPSEGEVLINGINLHTEKEKVEGVIGFVPQDDLLIEELTVFENLYYNAKLCFSKNTDEEIKGFVQKTVINLGLTAITELKVGSPLQKTISGGQRKRINIGLELIREPSILFLDEPTSGLSSKDSENVLDLLRELTLKGKLIFVVIHQPSSDIYKMFDRIVFLDTGGYLIYNGNPVEAISYFKNLDHQINSEQGECPNCGSVNPEMVFNIVEAKVVDDYGQATDKRKVSPIAWNKHYTQNVVAETVETITEEPPKSLEIPSKIKQFVIFATRDVLSKISNKQYILLNLLEAPVLAFFLSFIVRYIANPNTNVYHFRENENIPAYILMCIVVALFIGLTVSAEEIFRDQKILKREKFLNLSRAGYLCSKISILFTLSAIQTFLMVIIGNSILGVRGMYIDYWLMLFTVSCFANLLGLNISASFNSAVTIYIIIPLLVIPQMVLAGAMFSYDKLNSLVGGGHQVPLIAEVMAARWAYEGLVVNQFMNNEYEKQLYKYEFRESALDYKQAYYIPELQKIVDQCVEYITQGDEKGISQELFNKNLQLLTNEIPKEQRLNKKVPFNFAKNFTPEKFNKTVADSTQLYLDILESYYSIKFNAINMQKELKLNTLIVDTTIDVNQIRNNYFNDYLSDVVQNKYVDHKIIHHRDELIQVIDPIYNVPKKTIGLGIKYPFYTPAKFLFGKKMDTYWFNLIVIWLMCVFLYFALYYELLKKMLNLFEKIKLKED